MKEEAYQLNAVKLAYIGDAVFSLYVRTYFVKNTDKRNSELNKLVNKIVCAKNQAILMSKITDKLTDEERDITNRARNAHLNNKAKNSSFTEYHQATQFEALLGYLYLSDKTNRLNELLEFSINDFLDKEEGK